MRKITLLLFAITIIVNCYSQVEIFKTFQDYQNKTSTKYNSEIKYELSDKKISIRLRPQIVFQDTKEVIYTDSIWGFTYKGVLFRTFDMKNPRTKVLGLAALISNGKYCYWEIGEAWMNALNKPNKTKVTYDVDMAYSGVFYFSTTVDSDIKTHNDFRVLFNSDMKIYKSLTDCAFKTGQSIGKYKNIKMGNKIFKLGGEDGIAYVKMFSMSKEFELMRECVKSDNGNVNSKTTSIKLTIE